MVIFWILFFGLVSVIGIFYLVIKFRLTRTSTLSVAFFHPYCAAGGGGERVLWSAIKSIQQINPNAYCFIYTGDNIKKDELMKKVKDSFGIVFDSQDRVNLVYLKRRNWVEASRYPVFTMIGQSLGSIILAFEALSKLNPHIVIDTMGYAFTFPVFSFFGGCKVGCYVHYPTISTDMLNKVVEQRPDYNNDQRISGSKTLSYGKYVYYQIFAFLYGLVGKIPIVVMTNSSWTESHIKKIWGKKNGEISVVFPPCDTSNLTSIPLDLEKRQNIILSIGQFRPEKDHALQLHVLHEIFRQNPALRSNTKLVFVGSCRNDDDRKRVSDLKTLAERLDVTDNIEFEIGIPFSKLQKWLEISLVGIHTMWNEHFGIGIVEFMAAGVITVAHNSGGPSWDIITAGKNGFLAATVFEYAEQISEILLNKKSCVKIQQEARKSALKYSEKEFITSFSAQAHKLFHNLH